MPNCLASSSMPNRSVSCRRGRQWSRSAGAMCMEWGQSRMPTCSWRARHLMLSNWASDSPSGRRTRRPAGGCSSRRSRPRPTWRRRSWNWSELGVADYYAIEAAGPMHNAISLGMFSTEEAANSFLIGLRARGVKSARVGEREHRRAFLVREPDAQTAARLRRNQERLSRHRAQDAGLPGQRLGIALIRVVSPILFDADKRGRWHDWPGASCRSRH